MKFAKTDSILNLPICFASFLTIPVACEACYSHTIAAVYTNRHSLIRKKLAAIFESNKKIFLVLFHFVVRTAISVFLPFTK